MSEKMYESCLIDEVVVMYLKHIRPDGDISYFTHEEVERLKQIKELLDSNSEKAEVQAYFDGQAYGWEQGRKALLDDVKTEIDNLRNQRLFGMVSNYDLLDTVLEILDNIGKGGQ